MENSPAETTPQTPPPQSPLKQIRTYQGDVATALAQQNESLYSIQAKEHAKNGPASLPLTKSALPLLAGSLLLIAFAAFAGYFAYGEFNRKTAPPPLSTPVSRFLPAESTTDLDIAPLARDTLIAAFAQASSGVKVGELRYINLTKGTSTATAAQFFATLEAQVPGSLERALEPIFMAGTLGNSQFLIFKLASFPNAFGGMLTWEQRLPSDIGPLFTNYEFVKSMSAPSVFKDVVHKNKDARVLYMEGVDVAGSTSTIPVLLYSFFDNRMLIITDRLETLQTLIDRLTQENLTR